MFIRQFAFTNNRCLQFAENPLLNPLPVGGEADSLSLWGRVREGENLTKRKAAFRLVDSVSNVRARQLDINSETHGRLVANCLAPTNRR